MTDNPISDAELARLCDDPLNWGSDVVRRAARELRERRRGDTAHVTDGSNTSTSSDDPSPATSLY